VSFRNVHFDAKRSKMHLWEQIDGINQYKLLDFVPYVFIKNTEKAADAHGIFNEPVMKETYKTYFEYITNTKNKSNLHENRIKPEIQFLVDRYYQIPDDELQVPKLRIFYWDIEVYCGDKRGFPHPKIAEDPIVLMSVLSSINNKIITFGTKDYHSENGNLYIKCADEKDLIIRFLSFMNKADYDVLSGWNIRNFDIPFLINRIKREFKDQPEIFNQLSPINNINIWTSKLGNTNYDIAGISFLDYMEIYKKYNPVKLFWYLF